MKFPLRKSRNEPKNFGLSDDPDDRRDRSFRSLANDEDFYGISWSGGFSFVTFLLAAAKEK